MVTEHALLSVIDGEEAAFETAFAEAKQVVRASPGCERVRLLRCQERPTIYLLLVDWQARADHVVTFRGSPAFARWRELVSPYWTELPQVEHFDEVASA